MCIITELGRGSNLFHVISGSSLNFICPSGQLVSLQALKITLHKNIRLTCITTHTCQCSNDYSNPLTNLDLCNFGPEMKSMCEKLHNYII